MVRNHIFALVVLALIAGAAYSQNPVGTSSIRAPAVILTNNTGSLTNITLTITKGDGTVSVVGPQTVGSSTLQSAKTAAIYASNYTNRIFSNYNFTYYIKDSGDNVSGPSAGAAMAMLAVSAFENHPLRADFTMTGTISANGSIGQIGGVYDKVAAANKAGMRLVLVPKVPAYDAEDELYLLVQTNFGIPLVQVANISQATYFAFNSNVDGIANQTAYSFYRNYSIGALPNASINCSESCNYSTFRLLINATFDLTRNEINRLASNPKFSGIGAQLYKVLDQSEAIANRSYLYTGADFAFINYVNTFYFNGYSTNRSSALSLLDNVKSFCGSLAAPPLTTSDYNYVISAELRQAWGSYTIDNVVNSYNLSQIDSDQILDELYIGAQANGWCTAANLVYNESSNQNSMYVEPSAALGAIALQRINSALKYGPSLYLNTAQIAYKNGNYPLAVIDADYAIALSGASSEYSLTAAQLDNISLRNANNSTYGVWATEFARESEFYIAQSKLTKNSTLAKSYSESAYAASLLASMISNDTKLIANNLVAVQQPVQNADISKAIGYISYSQGIIFSLLIIIIALLLLNIVLIAIVLNKTSASHEPKGLNRRRRNSR